MDDVARELTTAILLLVLIEVRTALARAGLGPRRRDDQTDQ